MKNAIITIANHYGLRPQSDQTIEEMAELTLALRKFWRCDTEEHEEYKRRRCDIAEEIADVEIMLEQLKYLFDIETETANWKIDKINRQMRRIHDERRGEKND